MSQTQPPPTLAEQILAKARDTGVDPASQLSITRLAQLGEVDGRPIPAPTLRKFMVDGVTVASGQRLRLRCSRIGARRFATPRDLANFVTTLSEVADA